MPLSPTWFDHPGRDPERYFLEAWSASVLDRVTDGHPFETRTTWASFTGLATHRHYDHGAAVLYEYLVALPHVVAPGEDRLVAQTVGLPYLAADVGLLAPFANTTRDSRGRRMRASKIAPIRPNCPHSTPSCQDCAIRIAQLLAYLTRGINIATLSDDHRTLLSDTAHRMLRLGLDPAIPAGDQVSLPTHATR